MGVDLEFCWRLTDRNKFLVANIDHELRFPLMTYKNRLAASRTTAFATANMQHPRSTTSDNDSEKSDLFVTLFPEVTYGQYIRTLGVERLSAKQEVDLADDGTRLWSRRRLTSRRVTCAVDALAVRRQRIFATDSPSSSIST